MYAHRVNTSSDSGRTNGPGQSDRTVEPVQKSLLTKPQAARFLGIGLTSFKRYEKEGVYVHTQTDEKGRRLYSRAYLERRKWELDNKKKSPEFQAPQAPEPHAKAPVANTVRNISNVVYTPKEATLVFDELDVDENLVRIIKKLELHPLIVRAIYSEWQELRKLGGGFYVSGESAQAINALELDGFPVSSGEELVDALGAIASTSRPCSSCAKRPRRVTTLCAPCERLALEHRAHGA
jgi:hypothetical protein